MAGFLRAALGFPTVLFSFALLVVAGYWLVVLLGGIGVDAFDGGDGVHAGTAGIPVTAMVSTGIVIAWFVALAGDALIDHRWLRVAVLPPRWGRPGSASDCSGAWPTACCLLNGCRRESISWAASA